MIRKAEIELEFQDYISHAPVSPKELFGQACSSDEVTINSWRDTWQKNVKANHDKYGSFADHAIGKFYGYAHQKPVIVAGAGPSLKHNIQHLKDRESIVLVSCLHNFHTMEDNDAAPDFYVSLDAGEVVVEEVYEGGKRTEQEYWDLTKNRKLLCYIGTHPKLLEKWQGEVYFFNAPVPDAEYNKFLDSVEVFNSFVSNGGNVLGACLYISKAILGSPMVAFIGADFSFSYDKKFHSYDTKYDKKLGNVIKLRDVFGMPVVTWRSYYNFKGWFEYVSLTVPGIYFNASEGGCLGAYNEGNLRSIIQIRLVDFIRMVNMYSEIKAQMIDPKVTEKKLLF